MHVPSSACLSTTVVSLLKFAIGNNLQIDRNLDDKAATASTVNSCMDMHGHSMIKLDRQTEDRSQLIELTLLT